MDPEQTKRNEPEMVELPESWRTFPSGEPVPDWVAAFDEARGPAGELNQRYHRAMAHATKADEVAAARQAAIERTRGMFAHLAPGESLADELIADRRAEVHAEELQETEQRRRRGAD